MEALQRFADRLTDRALPHHEVKEEDSTRTPARKMSAAEEAKRQLRELGI
jgi:hypothetical protein